MQGTITKNQNRRIAKNTIYLYLRSIVVMVITLYTSRLTLKYLGFEDYGLYNVIGGVVGLFAFLRTSMTKGTQRFLNVEMVNPNGNLNETFCLSINIHLAITIITLIICETIGLWFLNYYIQIPEGREFAANIVYQATVISLLTTIISVPYSADIIAHEEMGFFAVVSIIDAFLKLLISFLIVYGDDRLILYASLMTAVSILNLALYYWYCRKHYVESKYRIYHNKKMTKSMLGYTSWTVVGQCAILGTNQGNNILVNIFHGVTSNAAMGIASQVNSAVVTLTSNFQTAFNPQITKSYASKDFDYLKRLVYTTSKISFMLLAVVCMPLIFNIDYILKLWLSNVPPNAADFCVLIICNTILNAFGAPFNFTVLSSGKIKWFQIFTSIAYLSDLLILYPLFILGYPATTALVVKLFTMAIVTVIRVYFAHREVKEITIISFVSQVLLPLLGSTILTVAFGYFVFGFLSNVVPVFLATILLICVAIISNYYVSLTTNERALLRTYINKIKKRNR